MKPVMNFKFYFTGNVLWPIFTECKLQIDQKSIRKKNEDQKSKYVL